MNETAVVATKGTAPAVVDGLSVNELLAHVAKIKEVLDSVLKEGEHYGPSFPGDDKKNLLKPGADKLKFVFRLAPEYKETIIDLPNGHREVRIKTILRSITTGAIIAEGLGSCSTMEGKYRWRNSARCCPECGAQAIQKGKAEFGGGFFCSKKKDGCGANFDENDQRILNQVVGKVENPDIADTWNTVYKIAKKRSDVDATITALAASDIFTQDADDLPATESHEPAPAKKEVPAKKEAVTRKPSSTPIEERMKKAQADVVTYVTAEINGIPAFSDDEKAIAKKKLTNLDANSTGILRNEANAAYLESIANEYKKVLDRKIEESKNPPRQAAQDVDDAADKAFEDDIPGEPAKPAELPPPEQDFIF